MDQMLMFRDGGLRQCPAPGDESAGRIPSGAENDILQGIPMARNFEAVVGIHQTLVHCRDVKVCDMESG